MRTLVTSSMLSMLVPFLIASSVSAAPTTKPATAPFQAATVGRDNRLVTCDAFGFRFQVPKTWKTLKADATAGRFTYEMTSSTSRSEEHTPTFNVIGAQACHGDLTLDAEVKAVRDSNTGPGNFRLIKEEPTQLGGEPAHAMVFEDEIKPDTSNWPKNKPLPPARKSRTHMVVSLHEGKVYFVEMGCDAKTYDAKAKVFNRAVQTFEWIAAPGSSGEKKT